MYKRWWPNLDSREYQDSEFFPDQFQNRGMHLATEIPNVKEFFKNIHSLQAGLSFKLTKQVASFIQSANDSQAELFIRVLRSPPDSYVCVKNHLEIIF